MKNPALQLRSNSATDALREAVAALQRAHIETASLDARLLLQHVLGISREQLLEGDSRLTPPQESHYRDLIGRRLGHQPVAQLIGQREFWGLAFRVTEATLDPRPDSETLIEAVLARFPQRDAPLAILDLGTGTGCLLMALLKEFPQAHGVGIDSSGEALDVARDNAWRLGMQERCEFLQSNWGGEVLGKKMFDIVISNPPYIPAVAIAELPPAVRDFEPRQALDGGEDGLDCYRAIAAQLPRLLAEGGLAAFEIGAGQRRDVQAIIADNGLHVTEVKDDLAGIPRCVLVKKPNNH